MEASVEEKGQTDIETTAFVESAIINRSHVQKVKANKLADSTTTEVSKKGEFVFFGL